MSPLQKRKRGVVSGPSLADGLERVNEHATCVPLGRKFHDRIWTTRAQTGRFCSFFFNSMHGEPHWFPQNRFVKKFTRDRPAPFLGRFVVEVTRDPGNAIIEVVSRKSSLRSGQHHGFSPSRVRKDGSCRIFGPIPSRTNFIAKAGQLKSGAADAQGVLTKARFSCRVGRGEPRHGGGANKPPNHRRNRYKLTHPNPGLGR